MPFPWKNHPKGTSGFPDSSGSREQVEDGSDVRRPVRRDGGSPKRPPLAGSVRDNWDTPIPESGYPKGMGHGPRVSYRREDGRMQYIEGLSYEALLKYSEGFAEMVDSQPVDQYGNLRIFMKSTSEIEYSDGSVPVFELGNPRSARALAGDLMKQSRSLDKGAGIGYADRPNKSDDTTDPRIRPSNKKRKQW